MIDWVYSMAGVSRSTGLGNMISCSGEWGDGLLRVYWGERGRRETGAWVLTYEEETEDSVGVDNGLISLLQGTINCKDKAPHVLASKGFVGDLIVL